MNAITESRTKIHNTKTKIQIRYRKDSIQSQAYLGYAVYWILRGLPVRRRYLPLTCR